MKPDDSWAVYYRQGKKVKWEYFGRGAEGEAAAYLRNDALGLGRRSRRRKPTGPLVAHLAMAYYKARTDLGEVSRRKLATRLEATLLPHFGHIRANRLTDADVDRYVTKRRRTVKDGTIRRELTDLKSILNWATHRKPPLLQANPITRYRKPAEDSAIIMPPTADELARILAVAPPHLKRAVMLAHYTGLRPGAVELLTITWDQVDIEGGQITVVSAKKGGVRRRLVPYPPGVCGYTGGLRAIAADGVEGVYIVRYRGKPIKKILRPGWQGALARAGITRRIRPYDLRHAFDHHLALEAGADIGAVAGIVGSSPETIRKHYQHVTERLRRATVGTIPSLPLEAN